VRQWVKSGCVDVATGKMRVCDVDIKCGCVGKKQMCGCDLTFTLKVSCLFVVCVLLPVSYKLAGLSLSRMIGLYVQMDDFIKAKNQQK